MNVIFHTTTAIGVTVLLTNTIRIGDRPTTNKVIPTALCVFAIGIISHGVSDFIPHCYPINSRVDVITGLIVIFSTIWLTNRHYRLIIGLAFLGCIFPDIVDLAPKTINRHLNLGLTIPNNIFPWHWHEYSGSIYNGNCNVSTLNHLLLAISIIIALWTRQTDLKIIFKKN